MRGWLETAVTGQHCQTIVNQNVQTTPKMIYIINGGSGGERPSPTSEKVR